MMTTIVTVLVVTGIAAIVRRFERREEKYPNLLP